MAVTKGITRVKRVLTWRGLKYYIHNERRWGTGIWEQVSRSEYRAAKAHVKHRSLFERMYVKNQRKEELALNAKLRKS